MIVPIHSAGQPSVRLCRAWPSPSSSPRASAGAVVNSSFNSFIIRDLKPSTLYKVHIMASTVGGSTNGTSLTLVTMVLGEHGRVGFWGCWRGVRGPTGAGSCPKISPPVCKGHFLL